MKLTFLLVISLTLTGCSQIYTVPDPVAKKGRIKGVPFYGQKIISKPIKLDRIIHDKTGNITHSAYAKPGSNEYCLPVDTTEQVVVADYSKPQSIYLSWSLFEIRKFGVTLDKGMLAGVNSEVTPGPRVATEMLQDVVGIRQTLRGGGDEKMTDEKIKTTPALFLTCSHYK